MATRDIHQRGDEMPARIEGSGHPLQKVFCSDFDSSIPLYPKETALTLSWPGGVVRNGKDERNAPADEARSILASVREGNMEIQGLI
jgi:hypothetical protein